MRPERGGALAEPKLVAWPLLLRPALTLLALLSVALAARLSLRLHASGGADPGLGHRAGRAGSRGAGGGASGPAFPRAARGRGVRARLPGVCGARARVGVALGLAPGQRAQDAAPGRGARPLAHVRRRGGERADGDARDAPARRVARVRSRRRRPRVVGDARGRGARRGRPRRDPRDADRAPGGARARTAASIPCSRRAPRSCSRRRCAPTARSTAPAASRAAWR